MRQQTLKEEGIISYFKRKRQSMTRGRRSKGTDWLGVVSLGLFFIAVGTVFVVTPDLTGKIREFLNKENFDWARAYSNVWLPAPKTHPSTIYEAIMNFCFIFGASQIIVLILRFALRDLPSRKAETASGTVFWLGMGVFADFADSLSAEPGFVSSTGWFSLLSGLIMMIGVLIISRTLLAEFLRRL
jgi:prolipoprotein diacylglyceryltransferase